MLGMALQVAAQGVSLRASAPSMVEVGEKFRVQYSVNTQNVSDFTYPSFTGFVVVYGPSTSSSSSIQIINGQMSQSSSYTYTFTMYAEHEGTFTIPAASIQSDGKTYLRVATSDGWLNIKTLQLEGKKRMAVTDLLRGLKIGENAFFV